MTKVASKNLIGRPAFLRDFYCVPKQVGGCRIIALSSKGPEWVVVEWSGDNHEEPGGVSAVLLSHLDVR